MATRRNQLSWCCFAPITVDDGVWQAEDTFHYCSWCGAEAKEYFTQYTHDTSRDVELVARRFKDGEASYSELKHAIEYDVQRNWNVLIDDIKNHLQGGKEGPVWEFDINRIKWVKVGEDNTNAE